MESSAKKKAAVSAVAAVTAAGVLVGGAFNSPGDILDHGPDALVQTVDMELDSQYDAGDDSGDNRDEEKGGIKTSLRRLIGQAPLPVRAFIALPLWLVGTGLIELGALLWGSVLSPVMLTVINWAAVALLVLAVFLLAARTIAPDLPIRKILNKKTVPGILILCFGFGLLDALLPLVWDGYEGFAQWLRIGGSCICTAVPIAFFMRRHKRRLAEKERERREHEAELDYARREREARLLIEELADSVSRHY